MAVNKVPIETTIKIQQQTGVDTNGDPIYKYKNLRNVKTDAIDQDIFDVASALANLQNYTLTGIYRIDDARLEETV